MPRPLLSAPVEPFHERSLPALVELAELEAVTELLTGDCYVIVDNRLAIPTETRRGADPGGFWV